MKNNFNNFSFYHIYPLGLCGANEKNDFITSPQKNLSKLYDWIPYIKSLGCNAIYLGPVFESSTHGYDTTDYFYVDRRLGNNEDLKKIILYFHENGIKVIFDTVFNHVGRDFWAFKDVQENREQSKFKDWFQNLKFEMKNQYGEPYTYDCWEGHMSLVKLNHNNPEVRQHLLMAAKFWIKELGADGLRIDAADCISLNFLKEINIYCKKLKPDFWIMGEIIHGDYRKWLSSGIFDSVTNYECYKGLYSSFNDKNLFEIAYSLNRQFGKDGIYNNHVLYNFVDNHDVNRISSTLIKPDHFFPLHALLFTIPGIPSIYYGSELGIEGKKTKESDKLLRPELNISEILDENKNIALVNSIKKFSKIRNESKALKYGNYIPLMTNHEQFVFARQFEDETYIIAINASENESIINFDFPYKGDFMIDLLNEKEVFKINGKITLNLWPNWARILKVER